MATMGARGGKISKRKILQRGASMRMGMAAHNGKEWPSFEVLRLANDEGVWGMVLAKSWVSNLTR